MDDQTLMTTESMNLVLNDRGCCVRHPHIRLKEKDENGDVYLKESCPECHAEFESTQEMLKEKKRELDRKIERLGGSPQRNTDMNQETPRPPPATDGLAAQMQHIQYMQDIMLFQKDQEVQELRKKLDEKQKILMEKEIEVALLKERMSQQKLNMERELSLIQRAVALDRQARGPQQNDEPEVEELHIEQLHVQVNPADAAKEQEAVRKQLNNSNGRLPSSEKQQVKDESSPSLESDEVTPVSYNKAPEAVAMAGAVAATTGAATAAAEPKPTPQYDSPGEYWDVIEQPADDDFVSIEEPQAAGEDEETEFTQDEKETPPPPSPKPTPKAEPEATYAMPQADEEASADKSSVSDRKQPAEISYEPRRELDLKIAPLAGVPKATTTTPKEPEYVVSPPDEDDEEEYYDDVAEEAKDTFDMNTGITPPVRPHDTRGGPLMASMESLTPPQGGGGLQPKSHGIPGVSEFKGRGLTPVNELEIDLNTDPMVPVDEDVTLGSVSYRHLDDPTVASSTFGEERHEVRNFQTLDPYGDKGIYTGSVLLSTNMPHGHGKMVYEDDGRTYEGEWRHGRWHGKGKATFSNGDLFVGMYQYDQRHGKGKYNWRDGRIYEGEFKDDKRHGKGHFTWPDGAEFVGDFLEGQREGHGIYLYANDGGRYVGNWVDGRYEGYGECWWADGRVYKGEWKNGMCHGQGVETGPGGAVRHEGQWFEDEPVRGQ